MNSHHPIPRAGRRKALRSTVAAGASIALVATLAACSTPSEGGDENIRLTVATFNNFGYTELYEEYMEANPNIEIVEEVSEYQAHHTQLATRLAAGNGAADVVAIADDFIAQFTAQPQNFYNLLDYGAGDLEGEFLPWKWDLTLSEGSQIGLGTDVGGLGICYRADLMAEAGLPSDREELAALWPTWEAFLEVGDQFEAAGTSANFFDSGALLFNAIVGQAPEAFYDADGNVIVADNPAVKEAYDLVIRAVESGQSAKLAAFSSAWSTGFQQGSFALMTCPAWMMAFIQSQAPDTSGLWDVTTMPGTGGGNWGGSWLTVPAQGDHPEEAYKLAEWLTAPEQALRIFTEIGNLPPLPALYEDPAVVDFTNPFFSDAPVGQLFSSGAAALEPQPQGPAAAAMRLAIQNGIGRVEQGSESPADSWMKALDEAIEAGE
jgi:cellobiose transport system substrate-binding protein